MWVFLCSFQDSESFLTRYVRFSGVFPSPTILYANLFETQFLLTA